MVPTTSIATFISKNDSELRSMTTHICEGFNYPGDPEDIVQDMYLKLLTNPIVENYQEERVVFKAPSPKQEEIEKKKPELIRVRVKMSTYIYSIIKNLILSKLKSREQRVIKFQLPDCEPLAETTNELDTVFRHTPINLDYQTVLLNNESPDGINGIAADLKDFEISLLQKQKNKWFSLDKRKNKGVSTSGCTLIDILHYLYDGYSNSEIAEKYGVTDMSITNMKQKLAREMQKFGFGNGQRKSVIPSKNLKAQIQVALEVYERNGSWVILAKLMSEARNQNENLEFTGLKNNINRMIGAYDFLREWRPRILETPEKVRGHYRAISPLRMLHNRLPVKTRVAKVQSILDKVINGEIPAYVVERYATTLVDPSKKKMEDYVTEEHLKNLI
jgi:DNA-directed RNA polymerase specialized sigma24 family protein